MSEQQIRSLVVREDERGLYVRTREGVLRFFGDTPVRVGDHVRLTINYLPDDAGRYDPIPAARCYRGDALQGNLSWD